MRVPEAYCYRVQACSAHCTTGQWARDKEYDFIRKASRPRRWQTSVSEKPSYGVWLPVSFIESERELRWGSKLKGPFVLQNISWPASVRGCVSFVFLAAICRWTGSDCLPVSWTAEGQCSLRQAIMYDCNTKNNEKQRLKSKKQIQRGVHLALPCYSTSQ